MARVTETISTINSLLRTILAVVVLGAIGAGGFIGYNAWYSKEHLVEEKEKELAGVRGELEAARSNLSRSQAEVVQQKQEIEEKKQEINRLTTVVAELEKRVEKLEVARRLLKMSRRLADIRVVEQGLDEKTGDEFTVMDYQEVNDQGQPIEKPRRFRLKGNIVYVDFWVVKFDDKYIEEASLERGTSICWLKGVFGKPPTDYYHELDKPDAMPAAYGISGRDSLFEKQIWSDFWNIANDPAKAESLGIRSIHGDAPNMRLEKGKQYRVDIRSTGSPEIRQSDAAAKNAA